VSTLRAVTWNVCVENHAVNVHEGLVALAKRRPHVIALQECYHLTGRDKPTLPGYTTYQLPHHPDVDGQVNESASVAVLIRNDVTVKRHRIVRMKTPWVGPKAGKKHAPRVWHAFVLVVDGTRWKVSGGHWAYPAHNAAAVAEHEAWLRRWQRALLRPTAHLADFNQHATALHDKGFRAFGEGVDLAAIGKHARVVRVRKVEHEYGSDHFPVEIDLAA
jgi:hypothetical protein